MRRVITNALGAPNMISASEVQARKSALLAEAQITLSAIANLAARGVEDPWADPQTLAQAVSRGILDAPQLRSNPFAKRQIRTRIVNGACLAVDENDSPINEVARLAKLL